MKFKKGSKVEVMNKKEVPVSWFCAEIMSSNGHAYTVRYDGYMGSKTDVVVEKVLGKDIRPCPPNVEGVENWVSGEIVEVFRDNSWRIATVLKLFDGDRYLVRLLGNSQEFRVHKSSIRVRQSWSDEKWVVIRKDSRSFGDVKSMKLSNVNGYQKATFELPPANTRSKPLGEHYPFAVRDRAKLQESHIISSRTLKRASPYCSPLLGARIGNFRKIRAIEKEGRRERAIPIPSREKAPVGGILPCFRMHKDDAGACRLSLGNNRDGVSVYSDIYWRLSL